MLNEIYVSFPLYVAIVLVVIMGLAAFKTFVIDYHKECKIKRYLHEVGYIETIKNGKVFYVRDGEILPLTQEDLFALSYKEVIQRFR